MRAVHRHPHAGIFFREHPEVALSEEVAHPDHRVASESNIAEPGSQPKPPPLWTRMPGIRAAAALHQDVKGFQEKKWGKRKGQYETRWAGEPSRKPPVEPAATLLPRGRCCLL